MRDALPHLFAEDPALLHRLATILSPAELAARGVPVSRCVYVYVCVGFTSPTGIAMRHTPRIQDWRCAPHIAVVRQAPSG
jgi:hypothetical protein